MNQPRPLSVAPMMDHTDRDFRYFLRTMTRHTFLYTEMVTTGAIRHGDRRRLLEFSPVEHPLALQLGGDEPRELAECARIAADFGYDELNLNVGCPSDRVQSGNFGACLMADPGRVAECVAAMAHASGLPTTVKHRIGIDVGGRDTYEHLTEFVRVVSAAGCRRFIVHARIAILGKKLSPRDNREIPPLRYDDVFQLKRQFPHLAIEINGGIRDFGLARRLLAHTDGVMIGRAAYENPYLFATADQEFYGSSTPVASRREILETLLPYLIQREAEGRPARTILRHVVGLFLGKSGARLYRRLLTEANAATRHRPARELVGEVLARLPAESLEERAQPPFAQV